MKNTWATLWPHEGAGPSSRPLARGIGIDWKRTNRIVRPDPGDTIINWGRATRPAELLNDHAEVWNPWDKVAVAVDKLQSLTVMKEAGVNVPEFTTDREIAREWLRDGRTVLVRSLLRASRGRGIVVVRGAEAELPPAPLYVKYRKKQDEYRIHVFNGQVLDAQQKRRRREFEGDIEEGNRGRIRSWANGWVFTREGVVPPACVIDQSLRAVSALGLTFGAVDVGYRPNAEGGKATVYEVNTAPALEGTTLEKYIAAFKHELERKDVA